MAKINDSGFVEYITELINETIDSISIAHLEQEQKLLDIKSDLLLSDKGLIEKYNLDEQISDETLSDKEKKDLLEEIVNNHRELISNYLNNGLIKTFVDGGKLSTEFIFTVSNDNQKSDNKDKTKNNNPSAKKVEIKNKPNNELNKTIENKAIDLNLTKIEKNKISKVILKENNFRTPTNSNIKFDVSPIVKTNSSQESEDSSQIKTKLELTFRTTVES